jgi:hypothetical protein
VSGLTYADGFIPIPIKSKALRVSTQTLEDVEVWDGVTYSGTGLGVPSKFSDEQFPVVGYGTQYPFGLDLDTAVKLYMRPKILRVKVGGLDAFTATGGEAEGSFSESSVFLDCDASLELESMFYVRVQGHRDLVPGPSPRFYVENLDFPPGISGGSQYFTAVHETGRVDGVVAATSNIAFFDGLIYKVGGLYYPQLVPTFTLEVSAARYSEEDDGGLARTRIVSLTTAQPPSGFDVVAVACKIFGEDREMFLRCVESVETSGSGAIVDGGHSDIELDIGVPPDAAGWLTYGGIYNEDTGEPV